ncbi:MAG: hypothetical protein WC705_00930 [Candidatus Paceibacterota bacterium]|jgi:hypothetical protein
MNNHEIEPGREHASEKLSKEEIMRIVEEIRDDRLHYGDDDKEGDGRNIEFFRVHLKNGIVYIPKWKRVLHKDGTRVDIKDEILAVLREDDLR